jgi:hypothetical protein
MTTITRRSVILDEEVSAYLTCWQSRDREFSVTGNAPISETVNELIRNSPAFIRWQATGQLPSLGELARKKPSRKRRSKQ